MWVISFEKRNKTVLSFDATTWYSFPGKIQYIVLPNMFSIKFSYLGQREKRREWERRKGEREGKQGGSEGKRKGKQWLVFRGSGRLVGDYKENFHSHTGMTPLFKWPKSFLVKFTPHILPGSPVSPDKTGIFSQSPFRDTGFTYSLRQAILEASFPVR